MDSMEEWERKAPIRRECRIRTGQLFSGVSLGIYRFFQYLTSIGDMMGLIIKKLTQVPQERFRLR
jgi:hypothetical protein